MAVTSWICLVFAVAKMNASACFDPSGSLHFKAKSKPQKVGCQVCGISDDTSNKTHGTGDCRYLFLSLLVPRQALLASAPELLTISSWQVLKSYVHSSFVLHVFYPLDAVISVLL